MSNLAASAFILNAADVRIAEVDVEGLTLDEAAAACYNFIDDALDPAAAPFTIEIQQEGDDFEPEYDDFACSEGLFGEF